MLWAANEVIAGRLTGAEPVSKEEKAAWRAIGKTPFSYQVPDTGVWVDYLYPLGPGAVPIAIAATLAQAVNGWEGEDEESVNTLENVVGATASLLGFFREQSFLDDLLGWVELVGETGEAMQGKGSFDGVMRDLGWWGGSYAPLNAIQRSILREFVTDNVLLDYERSGGAGGSSEELTEKLREGFQEVGLRAWTVFTMGGFKGGGVFPKIDHQGRDVQLSRMGGSWLSWLSPVATTLESTDRLDRAEHDVRFAPPRFRTTFNVPHPNTEVAARGGLPVRLVEPTPKELVKIKRRAGTSYRNEALRYLGSNRWNDATPSMRRVELGRLLRNARDEARRWAENSKTRGFSELHAAIRENEEKQTELWERKKEAERRRQGLR